MEIKLSKEEVQTMIIHRTRALFSIGPEYEIEAEAGSYGSGEMKLVVSRKNNEEAAV